MGVSFKLEHHDAIVSFVSESRLLPSGILAFPVVSNKAFSTGCRLLLSKTTSDGEWG